MVSYLIQFSKLISHQDGSFAPMSISQRAILRMLKAACAVFGARGWWQLVENC